VFTPGQTYGTCGGGGTCAQDGQSCTMNGDCCNMPTSTCVTLNPTTGVTTPCMTGQTNCTCFAPIL